ncbi:MAG TPA: FABP family protein [Actinobacteria bacterium]|nr:FABP family protein [Actinomycetota bacterium]HCK79566.1 FABP family protein [Actinomycetota bacterium]
MTPDLPSELVPYGWLIGTWAGAGVGGYPGTESFQFGQELTFAHDGRPFLSYWSRTWRIDDDGNPLEPLAAEAGFWRPQPDNRVEVTMAHPTGVVEIYVGEVRGAQIEIQTDVVARTVSAKEYTAAVRLYGLVNGELMWAYDMAGMGQSLQSHVSARLKRIG